MSCNVNTKIKSIKSLKQVISTPISALRWLSRKIQLKHLRSQRRWLNWSARAGICKRCWTHTGHMILLALLLSSSTAHAATASWYSTETCKINKLPECPTASGRSLYELERKNILFAAMWEVPFGTKVRVTNKNNGKSVIVEILDRGPARRLHRPIDLGKSAFLQLANPKEGLIPVKIEVMS